MEGSNGFQHRLSELYRTTINGCWFCPLQLEFSPHLRRLALLLYHDTTATRSVLDRAGRWGAGEALDHHARAVDQRTARP